MVRISSLFRLYSGWRNSCAGSLVEITGAQAVA